MKKPYQIQKLRALKQFREQSTASASPIQFAMPIRFTRSAISSCVRPRSKTGRLNRERTLPSERCHSPLVLERKSGQA